MNKILVVKAFEKARIQKKKVGIRNPSQTDLAEELSNFIDEHESFRLGERSFRDYHNDAKKLEGKETDINIKQQKVINGLCRYLGYNGYKEFIYDLELEDKSKPERVKIFIKKNKIGISILSAIVIVLIVYNSVTRQRWMVWQEDHYVEVKFDAEKFNLNQLKLYKEDRIKYFRKVEVSCDTIFFEDDETVRFWYGKNKDKELEYFTALGLHPETGKTLKPISQYMIDKYICVDSSKTPQ